MSVQEGDNHVPENGRILIVHEVLGSQGGAEGCVADGARLLREHGFSVAFLHEGHIGLDPANFSTGFDACFDARDRPSRSAARSWAPTALWFHTPKDSDLVAELLASDIPSIRTVHDHSSYCMRGYRYFPHSRRICTRTPGWGCLLTCAVLRDRSRRTGIKLGWPGATVNAMRLWQRCSLHLANSHYLANELLRTGLSPDTIRVLHPTPVPPPLKFRSDLSERRLIFTGQLIRGKGADQFLAACSQLKSGDWCADIIGDGPLRSELERQAAVSGLSGKVRFHGWVPREHLSAYYAHARAGIVPGMWPEPLGLTGIEFLQHGIPVIAYAVGGIDDWLRDAWNGCRIEHGDIAGLSQAMGRLLDDPPYARLLADQGREDALRRFDRQSYGERLIACLRDPLTGGRALPMALGTSTPTTETA